MQGDFMRKAPGVAAGYFFAYFVILLLIAFFARDEFINLDSWIPANKIASILAPVVSDPVTFLKAATDIYQHGTLLPENSWILHLWPPGFIFLEASLLKLVGPGGPLVALLQISICALFAAVFVLQRTVLRPLVGAYISSVSPLLILLFPVARIFLLSPAGVTFGEGFSVASFIASGLLIFYAVRTERIGFAVASGVSAAIAAYFRSQYESILIVETVFAVPVIVWFHCTARSEQVGRPTPRQATVIVRSLALSLLAAHLLMLPWRLHNMVENGSLGWVQTLDIVIENSLALEKPLLAKGGRFVIEGGGNLGCRLEPSYCGRDDKKLFWLAFVRNPVAWIEIKSALIGRYWFSSSKNITVVWQSATKVDDFCNIVFLLCMFGIPVLLVLLRADDAWPIILWLNASFCGAFLAIFVLVQLEVRYFYLVKIYSFSMCTLLLALTIGRFRCGMMRSRLNKSV
jgi:uncharacterized protein (DUF2062 family)